MYTTTREIRLDGFDDFLRSEKIVLVQLYDGKNRHERIDIDERIRTYFAGEYRSVGFGALDISKAFPRDIWMRKHLGSFSDRGTGIYLVSQGKFISFHSGKASEQTKGRSAAADAIAKAGHPVMAAVYSALEDMTEHHGSLSAQVARDIIEQFEKALGLLPNNQDRQLAGT